MHANVACVSYRRLALAIFSVNVLSAVLFIAYVPQPVYDDSTNLRDVHRYAAEGVTPASIRAHVNPTGPSSFIWISWGVRLIGGDELRAARIAVLGSWVFLGAAILLLIDCSESSAPWYAALLATLIFPHTMTTTATVMTEGPALLAAVLGTFLWLRAISSEFLTRRAIGALLIGGLAIGVAITARQYYLALVPGMAVVSVLNVRKRREKSHENWLLASAASIVIAAAPISFLTLMWGGLSSPAIASGASYAQWRAAVGLNFARPLTAAFDLSVWLVPLSFPAMWLAWPRPSWRALWIALATGLVAALFRGDLIQPGPLNSFLNVANRVPYGAFVAVAVIGGLACYNAIAVARLITKMCFETRSLVFVMALAFVIFFVLEQFGIGGNIPFYDRYVLQTAPFLGIIAFEAVPKLTSIRLMILVLLAVFSQTLLWRNAIAT